MNVKRKLEDNFLKFNERDYIKLFLNIKGENNPVELSYIDKNNLKLIQLYFSDFFIFSDKSIHLIDNYNTPQLLSEVFTFFAMELEKKEAIKIRHEHMLLQSEDTKSKLGYIDRSLMHFFGCKASGVHLNAYVEKTDSNNVRKKYLWIAKRSAAKLYDPNKLDNIVAGAVPFGFSNFDALKKEALEEAGISEEISRKAIYENTILYKSQKYNGLRNDIVYIYNLEVSENFVPIPVDGEVEEFFLISCDEVLEMLINNFDDFKYNSGLVIFYFLYSQRLIKNKKLYDYLTCLFDKLI